MVEKDKPTPAILGLEDIHAKLLKWLSYYKDTMLSAKIKSNIVTAAIYLTLMRNNQFYDHEVAGQMDLSLVMSSQFLQVLFVL